MMFLPRSPGVLLGAMATSGAYERGDHITDGRSGATASHWASVTVLDGDLTVADALATAVFAMGRVGGWIAHAREQARTGRLIRPQSLYVGPAPGNTRALAEPQPA